MNRSVPGKVCVSVRDYLVFLNVMDLIFVNGLHEIVVLFVISILRKRLKSSKQDMLQSSITPTQELFNEIKRYE